MINKGRVKIHLCDSFRVLKNMIAKLMYICTCVSKYTAHYSQFPVKVIAFTLAETLIVIGVIGIVSALTLPNLNSSTGDKERVAKVKKIYQNLNDAIGRAQTVYGPFDEWTVNDDNNTKVKRIGERITEFMKISKLCGLDKNTGCFNSGNILSLADGSRLYSSPEIYDAVYKVITADGTSVAFMTAGKVRVDIDGPAKGKNRYGYDFFSFDCNNNGCLPEGYDGCSTFRCEYLRLTVSTGSEASTSWIIKYDNADYLEFATSSDKKCKNGTAPTEENPRCK